jgi:hypothetical protein
MHIITLPTEGGITFETPVSNWDIQPRILELLQGVNVGKIRAFTVIAAGVDVEDVAQDLARQDGSTVQPYEDEPEGFAGVLHRLNDPDRMIDEFVRDDPDAP